MAGSPGFVAPTTPTTLVFNQRPFSGDPLNENVQVGRPLGFLGIELNTRRRNRVNGRVTSSLTGGGFVLEVDMSFGNCP